MIRLQLMALIGSISLAVIAHLTWNGHYTTAAITLALFAVGLGIGYTFGKRERLK